MQGEVKMQGDMQVKVNVPLYKRQAKGTGKTTDFDQLLRGKNQQLTSKQETAKETPEATGAVKRQPKKDGETSEAKTDSTNAEETVEPEDTQQNALLQAAMQQTAALMAGIMPDIQETPIDQEEITSIEELAGMEEMVAAPETRNQETAVVDAKLQEASWQIDLRKNTSGDIQELSIDMQHEKPGQEADEASVEKVLEPLDTQMKGRQEKTEASQQQIVQEDMAKQQKVNVTEVLENKGQQDQTDFSNSPKPEEYVKPVRRQEPAAGNEKTSSTKSLQQRGEGQVVAESVHTLHSARQESFFSQRTESTVPLKTTPDTLPQDLGKTLAKNMMESGRTLTVELEPAALGKLTIRMIYDGGRAAVSIMATNPKTQELLNQKASEIAAILEEKTGQETFIYIQQPETSQENYDREPDGRRNEEGQKDKKQNQEGQQADSFAQQLRLGLV